MGCARRAFRDDRQVINGYDNLSAILDTRVTELDVDSAEVNIKIRFDKRFRHQATVDAVFKFPRRGRRKQPLWDFLRVFYDIMQEIEQKDVDSCDKRKEARRFFLRVFQYSILRLGDACANYLYTMKFYDQFEEQTREIPPLHRPFRFEEDPYAQFMIWIEYLRKVKPSIE